MQKVLTAAQMREVDRLTTERYGIPSIILMENAAHAVSRVIAERLGGSVKGKSILILCGKGNNGGDGAALARVLWEQHADVYVVIVGKIDKMTGDAKVNFEFLRALSEGDGMFIDHWEVQDFGAFYELKEGFLSRVPIEFVVDALFGTGLTRPLNPPFDGIVDNISKWILHQKKIPVLSVDIPSGLAADLCTKVGPTVHAETTVTFTAPKVGNIIPPASHFNGELVVAHIGSPEGLLDEQSSDLFITESYDVQCWLLKSEFSGDSYKNKRGHALLIAGSENYSGAAVLAGNAAMRSGVGLVTIGTPKSSKDAIASRVVPEVMVRPLEETGSGSVSEDAIKEIEKFSKSVDAIAIGSGLSTDESTAKFVRHFVEKRRMPTILDADALTLLSPFPKDWPPANAGGSDLILTPHEGEFLRLLGTEDKDAIKDRVAAVREFSQKHRVILVQKGERVMIGEPGGKVVVNPTGNSGLGKAGNGDTLTGILAGFLAQAVQMKIDIFETVVAAVYVAGMAGDTAEKKYGKRVMTASDVRECLTEVFAHLAER